MDIPESCDDYGKGFLKLKKTIYGLKLVGRMWNNKLDSVFTEIGFKRLKSELCVNILKDKYDHAICIVAIYVNNTLIASKRIIVDKIKSQIKK